MSLIAIGITKFWTLGIALAGIYNIPDDKISASPTQPIAKEP